MVAGNPCYSELLPSLPERTSSAATLYVKPVVGVVPPVIPPAPGEQVRITVGNCYGPESPLPPTGGNVLYPRPRTEIVEPEEPTTPADEIRRTVGNCYIPGEPPRTIVPQEAGSPAVSNSRPRQGNRTSPPAARPGDLVRAIVDNCYPDDGTGSSGLVPDPGPYYPREKTPTPTPPDVPDGSEIIRELVDNCYGPPGSPDAPPPLTPNDPFVDKEPRPRQPETPPPDVPTPGEVIREIVERCYPPPIDPPELTAPPTDPRNPIQLFPPGEPPPWEWLCDLFPYLDICDLFPGPIVPPMPPFPPPGLPDGEDCYEVEVGLIAKTLKPYNYPKEKNKYIYVSGPDKGKILTCNNRRIPDDREKDINKCVRNYLDCLFKPYATGTYRTPPVDCNTFYFRGQNSTTKKICIAYCQPDRIPIYEYAKNSTSGKNISLTPISNDLDGGNSGASFIKHNLRVVTTDTAGNYTGKKVFCEAGAQFFNPGSGTQTHVASIGGASVNFSVRPITSSGGGDVDTEWWVNSFSGSLPSIGTKTTFSFNAGRRSCVVELEVIGGSANNCDHRYGTESSAPSGYYITNDGCPVFYILKEPLVDAVPLYRFFSSTLQDTFLTINPGIPDSPGNGERALMNAGGYSQGEILGYVFQTKSKAASYLLEGESISELFRFYNGAAAQIDCTFDSNGNVVASGTGSGRVKIDVSWDDDPDTAGIAFNTISAQGNTITKSGEKGHGSFMVDVTGGSTTNISYNGLQRSIILEDNNTKLCLRDNDGNDCNATVRIGRVDGESANATGTGVDHRYSLLMMHKTETPPEWHPYRKSYPVPSDPQTPFTITYKVKKGKAGYRNSWGVAICSIGGDTIYWARVIEGNTTRDIPMTQYTIPVDVLRANKCREIVFFLVPNGGSNGLSSGQSISFSRSAPGWKNSASVEDDWVFFVNPDMNPDRTNKVKYNGNHEQWWEDLHGPNSDEDYDDFKVTYRVGFLASEYDFEGIECYVYDKPKPDPILVDILVRDQCEEPLFGGVFQDSVIIRSQCGPSTPPNSNTRENYSLAGQCRGELTTTVRRTQKIKVKRSANLSLMSFGAIIRSPEIEELEFRFELSKNDTIIINETTTIGRWPRVGYNFGDFSVQKGDVLKFRIVDILRGPRMGSANLGFIIYDRDDRVFEKPWNVSLGTTPTPGEAEGRTETISDNPRIYRQPDINTAVGGRIRRLSIRLWDHDKKTWSAKVNVWNNGQIDTNDANGQDAEWNNVYYGGEDWRSGYGSFYEGGSNSRNSHILSSNIDSKGSFTGNPLIKNGERGIFYNSLFEHGRGLICSPSLDRRELRKFMHHSNGHGFTSWFTQIRYDDDEFTDIIDDYDDYYARGINDGGGFPLGNAVNSNGQYSKMSFMHDYVLGENDDGSRVTENAPSGKVRMAFWPYTVIDGDREEDTERFGNSIYWACAVECFDVLNEGKSYKKNETFDFVWPPKDRDEYQDADDAITPYNPRDEGTGISLPDRIQCDTLGTDSDDRFDNSYSPKQVFYQESHNRDSNLWYICQSDKKLNRIKFRIEIEETY